MSVEFLYYADFVKDNVSLMRSIVFDVIDKKIILSQSSPPLFRSSLKRDILVTYLDNIVKNGIRFGFQATVVDLWERYEIASGERVSAIIIERKSIPQPVNIRLNYRLKLPSLSGFALYVRDKRASIIDLSIGGVKISLKGVELLKPQDQIKLRFRFNNRDFNLEGEVVRIWSNVTAGRRDDVQLISIKFINADKEFEHLLGQQIFRVERQMLSEGKLRPDN